MTLESKSYAPGQRVFRASFAAAILLVLLAVIGLDVRARQANAEANHSEILAVVEQLGFADLALSSSARWLRTPSQSERSAPLTDAPLSFDTDPAGAVLGPVE